MKRLWILFSKCALEQKRDLWVLLLSLAFAPLFVFIYWLITNAGGSTSFGLLVINQDTGYQSLRAGETLVERLQDFSYESGSPFFKIIELDDEESAKIKLRNRDGAALVIIPKNFSQIISEMKSGKASDSAVLEMIGDLTYPTYTITAVSAMSVADEFIKENSAIKTPIEYQETPLGASAARSEFENYIPGLFVMAVVLMVFQASMMPVRECEAGKIIRYRLAGIRSYEFLGGISGWLLVVSIVSVMITFFTALLFGFRSQGSLWLAMLILAVTSLSIIGVGMIVASFSRSVSQAFVVANFPLGFLMFLSGSVFPLPRTNLFTIFNHGVAIYDLIPPTHAVIALNKIFTLGGGLRDVLFELIALVLLSILYFFVGVFLFKKYRLQ